MRSGISPELLESVQAFQFLDFIWLTSEIHISVVLSYQVCGNFLWQPQVTDPVALQVSETWSALDQLDTSPLGLDASVGDTRTLDRINSERLKWDMSSSGVIGCWGPCA